MNYRCLERLDERLINEKGMPSVGFFMGREDHSQEFMIKDSTVGEFLSRTENQNGDWFLDGGWGGPPGPIMLHWDELFQQWISFGYPPWDHNIEKWARIREDVWKKQK